MESAPLAAIENTETDKPEGPPAITAAAEPGHRAAFSPLPPPAGTAPDLGARVASQVADAARVLPDRPVELSLSPEELGRVKLTFALHDGVMNVTVHADRPETLDLMRRHIDSLGQEFRALGYRDASFSFGQQADPHNGQNPRAAPPQPAAQHQADPNQPPANSPAPLRLKLGSGGMDLRL